MRVDINSDLGERKAVWIRPELYFLSDTLITSEDGRSFLTEDFLAANTLGEASTRYVLPFEIASLLLTVALISAIVIAREE